MPIESTPSDNTKVLDFLSSPSVIKNGINIVEGNFDWSDNIKIYNTWDNEIRNYLLDSSLADLFYMLYRYGSINKEPVQFIINKKLREVIPISFISDYQTKEVIPIFAFDGYMPLPHSIPNWLDETPYRLSPCNRPDLIVRLQTDFKSHIKSLTNYGRQYERLINEGFEIQLLQGNSNFIKFYPFFVNYWNSKLGDKELFPIGIEYFISNYLMSNKLLYTLEIDSPAGEPLAYGIYAKDTKSKQIYWINTFRDDNNPLVKKYGIGNMVNVCMLKKCYEWGYDLNLGLDFEYKARWKPEYVNVIGIEMKG